MAITEDDLLMMKLTNPIDYEEAIQGTQFLKFIGFIEDKTGDSGFQGVIYHHDRAFFAMYVTEFHECFDYRGKDAELIEDYPFVLYITGNDYTIGGFLRFKSENTIHDWVALQNHVLYNFDNFMWMY